MRQGRTSDATTIVSSTGRAGTGRPASRDGAQPVDQAAPLLGRRPPGGHGEDIEVAVRPEAAEHRRAVQVHAEQVVSEDVRDRGDDPGRLLLLGRRKPACRHPPVA